MTQGLLPKFPTANTITIGGVTAPGQWILLPCEKKFGWDIRKGYALSGATVAPMGDELVVAPFLIKLWEEAQYQAFRLFRTTYLKKALFGAGNLATFALGINHPELNDLGVASVVCLESPVLTNNGRGLWTGTIKFLEYRKPIAALPKPAAAIPSANAPTPTAMDVRDQIIAEHEAELAAMRGK